MNVRLYVSDLIACGQVRGVVPAHEMNRRAAAGLGPVRVDVKNVVLYCDVPGTGAMIFQRQHEARVLEKMHLAQDDGIPCLYDIDDNLWAVEGKFSGPDGTTENCPQFFGRPEVREGLISFICDADAVICSSPELAEAVYRYTGRAGIHIVENAVDCEIWKPGFDMNMERRAAQLRAGDKQFTIGWHASGCHNNDAHLVVEALIELLRARPNVNLMFVGWSGVFDEFERLQEFKSRIRCQPWVELAALPFVLSQFDAGICCTEDTEFNRCKSAIKWGELSAAGVPAVCSPIPPYRRFAGTHTHSGAALLPDNSPEAWFTALDELAADPVAAAERGRAARAAAERIYNIRFRALEWERVILDTAARKAYKSIHDGGVNDAAPSREGALEMPPPPDDTGGTPVLNIA